MRGRSVSFALLLGLALACTAFGILVMPKSRAWSEGYHALLVLALAVLALVFIARSDQPRHETALALDEPTPPRPGSVAADLHEARNAWAAFVEREMRAEAERDVPDAEWCLVSPPAPLVTEEAVAGWLGTDELDEGMMPTGFGLHSRTVALWDCEAFADEVAAMVEAFGPLPTLEECERLAAERDVCLVLDAVCELEVALLTANTAPGSARTRAQRHLVELCRTELHAAEALLWAELDRVSTWPHWAEMARRWAEVMR